jgi:hypothetical protein
MKANEKKYSIICTTDPYNAGRHIGFKLNHERTQGIKVLASELNLKEAKKALDGFATEDLRAKNDINEIGTFQELQEMYKEMGIPASSKELAWYKGAGFYCNDEPLYIFGKNDSYSYDIFTYSIEEAPAELY